MTNIELLKAIRDALIAAVEVMENRLDDCDKSEPDTVPDTTCTVYYITTLYSEGLLSARAANCLMRAGYTTSQDAIDGLRTKKDLLKIPHMGPSTAANVLKCFHELGLKWRWEK
jgi:DNA-directed RNA polymerase alpha subunit